MGIDPFRIAAVCGYSATAMVRRTLLFDTSFPLDPCSCIAWTVSTSPGHQQRIFPFRDCPNQSFHKQTIRCHIDVSQAVYYGVHTVLSNKRAAEMARCYVATRGS